MAERIPSALSRQLEQLASRIDRLEARIAGGGPGDPGEGSSEAMRFCNLPLVPERTFDADVSPHRQELIRYFSKKWVNGTKLRYAFFRSGRYGGPSSQIAFVREAFGIWKDVGIGVAFEEVDDMSEAELRIGFLSGDGAWSYLGRDAIDIVGQGERTMNFGWDMNDDPRGVDVAVHEIGHALGFPHEHQNPFAGIVWNEDAVYRYFGGPPNNWSREQTFYNILRKITSTEVEGSEWDPDSIMHYAFQAGLIERPDEYRRGLSPAGGLSEADKAEALRLYPATLREERLVPFVSQPLALKAGEQVNFTIEPQSTRQYVMQTFGQSDTVVVLFEDQNGDLRYVAGDDDSGTSLNARIQTKLYKGRRYVLRIRLYTSSATGGGAVMLS